MVETRASSTSSGGGRGGGTGSGRGKGGKRAAPESPCPLAPPSDAASPAKRSKVSGFLVPPPRATVGIGYRSGLTRIGFAVGGGGSRRGARAEGRGAGGGSEFGARGGGGGGEVAPDGAVGQAAVPVLAGAYLFDLAISVDIRPGAGCSIQDWVLRSRGLLGGSSLGFLTVLWARAIGSFTVLTVFGGLLLCNFRAYLRCSP
jgi:hypothetical protein